MSMKPTLYPRLGFMLLKLAIAGWAAVVLVAHLYYWISMATGNNQPGRLQVYYGDGLGTVPDSLLDFVLSSIMIALLSATLWYALQMVRRLEVEQINYSSVIQQLARFAKSLFLYSASSAVATAIMASIDRHQQTGDAGIVLMLELDQINLLIISFVIFIVGKALRLADAAVQENQTFL